MSGLSGEWRGLLGVCVVSRSMQYERRLLLQESAAAGGSRRGEGEGRGAGRSTTVSTRIFGSLLAGGSSGRKLGCWGGERGRRGESALGVCTGVVGQRVRIFRIGYTHIHCQKKSPHIRVELSVFS